jgi:mRNA interferase MazF
MDLRRGDIVTVSLPGDYGKPRPAVIVQTDRLNSFHPSILVCPLTSELVDARDLRIDIEPSHQNGLRVASQAMVDKVTAVARERIGRRIGRLDETEMQRVEGILLFLFGIDER